MMATLLVVYYANEHPLRSAVRDHLYCFAEAGGHRCYYLNLAVRGVPRALRRLPIDLVVFHTMFLSCRWNPPRFRMLMERAEPLRALDAVKAAMPQDEFYHSDLLTEFIRRFDVSRVFTAAPESQWNTIYRDVDAARVEFTQVLTGYLSEHRIRSVERLAGRGADRPIDIGYRAWHAAPCLGRHGRRKVRLAEVVEEAAQARELRADISTKPEDTIFGDDWFRFLLRCRYTVGVEGGASIIDRDGAFRERTEAYLAQRSAASFEEVEQACFPGADGSLDLAVISPRHLEACLTRTGQVLIEGDYNGILRPGDHYIPLRADFSNLDDVLGQVEDEPRRQEMVERAYADIVASGRYGYDALVSTVITNCLGAEALTKDQDGVSQARPLTDRWLRFADRPSWLLVRVRRVLVNILKATGLIRLVSR